MKTTWKNKKNKTYLMLVLGVVCSILFVHFDAFLYDHPIALMTKTETVKEQEITGALGSKDHLTQQRLTAILQNGPDKGKELSLENEFSASGANDQHYQTGDRIFVTLHRQKGNTLTGTVDYPKRDTFIVFAAWLFLLTVLFVGKKSGLYSLLSLGLNVAFLVTAINLYAGSDKANLLLICSFLVLFFTVTSLFLISGRNEKTYAVILSTLLGTFVSFLIAFIVMKLTSEKGLYYEEMPFLTRSPQKVFLSGLLLGSLGAVMDVSITIISSLYELDHTNPDISIDYLKASGKEIGRDIMGSMTNVLFFAYISGSIPSLLLYLKNDAAISYTFSMNLSLEMARALTGGLGIVLTIPISIFIATKMIQQRRTNA